MEGIKYDDYIGKELYDIFPKGLDKISNDSEAFVNAVKDSPLFKLLESGHAIYLKEDDGTLDVVFTIIHNIMVDGDNCSFQMNGIKVFLEYNEDENYFEPLYIEHYSWIFDTECSLEKDGNLIISKDEWNDYYKTAIKSFNLINNVIRPYAFTDKESFMHHYSQLTDLFRSLTTNCSEKIEKIQSEKLKNDGNEI